jgi:lipid IVA palmitoyltransferase
MRNLLIVILIMVLCSALQPGTTRAEEDNAAETGTFAKITSFVKRIFREGDTMLYLSGYAYHLRGVYSEEDLKDTNEEAWGGGIGKVLIDEKNRAHELFLFASLDSHNHMQVLSGYMKQWRHSFTDRLSAGAGFMVFIMSRPDIFHGIPFPGMLPVAIIEFRPFALLATYIPTVNKNTTGKGNVLFVFGRINFGK